MHRDEGGGCVTRQLDRGREDEEGAEVFFGGGRSQLQQEFKQTRLQKETAGQSTENEGQRTKNKETRETGEQEGNKET